MICPVCKVRWAEYPEKDYKFNRKYGYSPKNSTAETRRNKAFQSDEEKVCLDGCV